MALGWIDPADYSFDCFLLLERFQIRLLFEWNGWGDDKLQWRRCMGLALRAHPVVRDYFARRCPECRAQMDALPEGPPEFHDPAELRRAEIFVLASVEDFVIYTTPEVMAEKCDFIRGWSKERLFALADFTGKTALDVGAGSGRLTFAAAERASWVYASEPVGTLREFMRDKIMREHIHNVRVTDGFVTDLPFPDDTFDIVMSGHVMGDNFDAEAAEMARVCKPGGWLLDCPGDSAGAIGPCAALTERGWEEIRYTGSFGKDVHIHRLQVHK